MVRRVRRHAGNALGLTGRVLRMVESSMRLVWRVLRFVGRAHNLGLGEPLSQVGLFMRLFGMVRDWLA